MTAAKGHIADKFAEYRVPIIKLVFCKDTKKLDHNGDKMGKLITMAIRYSYKKVVHIRNYYEGNAIGGPMRIIETVEPIDKVFKGLDVDAFYSIIREIVERSFSGGFKPMEFKYSSEKDVYINKLIEITPDVMDIKYVDSYVDYSLHYEELTDMWENTPIEEQKALHEELEHYMSALEIEQKEQLRQM